MPDCLPSPCRNEEDFTAEVGIVQYLLIRIVGKIELEIPLILRNGHSLVCHPGTAANNNVILSLHQGALLFLPRCHSCDTLKLIGAHPSEIYSFNLSTGDGLEADSKTRQNASPRANDKGPMQLDANLEQSDTAQRLTLLHKATLTTARQGNESSNNELQRAQPSAQATSTFPCANNKVPMRPHVGLEQSDAAQCPTLLHKAPLDATGKCCDSPNGGPEGAQSSAQASGAEGSNKIVKLIKEGSRLCEEKARL